MREKELSAFVESHLGEAIEDLRRLCRCPSVSAQGSGREETPELVAELLKRSGFEVEIFPTPGYPIVFGEARGRSPFTLLFYNHYDVQPPEPLEEWASPPFELAEREGKLFARGVADNKGDIVARLLAVRAVREVLGELPIHIKFLIEGEEESGSPNLPAFIEEHRELLTADGCIWEAGEVDWEGRPILALGVKGLLYVELEARGASTDLHSSMAAIIPNPAWRLVWALSSLKDIAERILIPGFYERAKPPDERERKAASSLPLHEEKLKGDLGIEEFVLGLSGDALKLRHLLEPTCTICGLQAGYTGRGSKTVLPSRASAKLEFRLVPGQDPGEIFSLLKKHLSERGFGDIEIRFLDGIRPARTPLDHPFILKVEEAAAKAYRRDPVIIPTFAASGPMALFSEDLGIPTVSCGIGYPESRPHAPNENIRVEDLKRGAFFCALLICELGGNPGRGLEIGGNELRS